MSATTSIRPTPGVQPALAVKDLRPGLGRLIAVELRKMVNTRSGFWVPIGVGFVTLLVAVIASINHGGNAATFTHVLHAASAPLAYLLPVMGVLLVCGEWSQRTKLATFTLVPSRPRVIAAKLGASWVVSTVALVGLLLFTVVSVSLFGHHPGGAGSLTWQVITQSWLYLASTMVIGLAFGAALLVSAPAIVVYLLLPAVWGTLVSNISAFRGIGNWLDSSQTLSPLTVHAFGTTDWVHAFATIGVWAGIPILIGWWRIGRGDID